MKQRIGLLVCLLAAVTFAQWPGGGGWGGGGSSANSFQHNRKTDSLYNLYSDTVFWKAFWPALTGSGTVTTITQANGIICTPNPITGSGTIALDTAGWKTWFATESSNVSVMAGVRARFTNLFGTLTGTASNALLLEGKDTTAL